MVRIFGKLLGSRSSSKATRRSYRPAFDVLEARAVPAVDAFIWFEAPGAVQDHHDNGAGQQPANKAFEIKDFSFDVGNPTTIGSATSGAGAGKIKFNEFIITKTTDRASPVFFQECCAGDHCETVIIEMRKADGAPMNAGQPFLQYRFGTVFTTKIEWSSPGAEGPHESISFVYGKLEVK